MYFLKFLKIDFNHQFDLAFYLNLKIIVAFLKEIFHFHFNIIEFNLINLHLDFLNAFNDYFFRRYINNLGNL